MIPAVPCSNVAVSVVLAVIVRRHVTMPVQRPDHPAKVVEFSGVAVKTTADPLGKLAVQLPGQLIPDGELVTVPPPVPALATVSCTFPPVPVPPDPTVMVTEELAVPPDPAAVAV